MRLISAYFYALEQELLQNDEQEKASYKLYQVFEGMPKNKILMQLMEDVQIRKLLEKTWYIP